MNVPIEIIAIGMEPIEILAVLILYLVSIQVSFGRVR